MLDKILQTSLNNRMLIILAYVILMVVGLQVVTRMDIDVFPDITAPTVVVMTDAHGMAPEEVERLVTFPIETAVNGATDVRRVRSVSTFGISFVWVEFDWGTDIFLARQIVGEKLTEVSSRIPQNIGTPTLAPQTSVMGEIVFIGLQSDTTSMIDLRTIAEWDIKPVLLATEGVAQVTIIGGDYKQYQVLADPYKMARFDVSMEELANTCRNISVNSPGNVLREYGNEYIVRGIARTNKLDELAYSVIKNVEGQPITIQDVARVQIGAAVKQGHGSQNGQPAIIMSVSKQPNSNTLDITERVEKNIEGLRQALPDDITIDTSIFRQADFIQTSIRNVETVLLEGAILVVIILMVFLMNFRTTIISLFAIPISLLASVIVLQLLGQNINTMSLGGMAIAIGSLVDDAIIDVENAYKRLRENIRLPKEQRKSSLQIVFDTSKEIRSSIIKATIIIIIAFLPLFFLTGMEGRMLAPLGISFIVSLAMSLIVAMTLTPVMCYYLLTSEKHLKKQKKEPFVSRMLSSWYKRSLEKAMVFRKAIIIGSAILFVIAAIILFSLGRGFLPEFNEGALTITAVSKAGISLDKSNEIGRMLEEAALTVPEVESTARRTGRGELDEHSQSVNSAEIDINYTLGDRPREEFLEEIREKLSQVPGVAFTVGQPLEHRIDHMISGSRANIAIKIFGEDLGILYKKGKEIEALLGDIEGVTDLSTEEQTEVPQLQIRADRERLAYFGIPIEKFTHFVDHAFSGEKLADIYEGQRRFQLILRLDSNFTQHRHQLSDALIQTADGEYVSLDQVSKIVSTAGPNSVSRENVQRKLVVSANVSGRSLTRVVEDMEELISTNIDFPEGYRVEFGGQFESAEAASRILIVTSVLIVLVIFLLLYQEFRDYRIAGVVLVNLPLALIGGVFAILISDRIVSIPSMIGFITLFGIATRNGILLVSRYQSLEAEGLSRYQSVLAGSVDRLNPILMTALSAGLALIPLALRGDVAGNEIQSPMAKVILGGLLTSTFLNIYVIPMVYCALKSRIDRRNKRLQEKNGKNDDN